MKKRITFTLLFAALCGFVNSNIAADALQITKQSGIKGGFVVHIGCGDGSLTTELKAGKGYNVHGLDTDPKAVEKALKRIGSIDHNGAMSAAVFDGKNLPYIDNMVNFLYCSKRYQLADNEIRRVLVPRGKAIINENGKERIITKEWPDEYDEWNHYLHNPDNNAVSKDTAIRPPLMHLQWKGSPKFSRHHDKSVTHLPGLVSANGKIFYIIDNGPRASILWPANFQLIARDAFNGVVLWQKQIEQWTDHLSHGVKEGPAVNPRRLVAIDNSVYVTLGVFAPVTKLDATTGEVVKVYKGTEKTEEILIKDGVMYLVINPSVSQEAPKGMILEIKPKIVMAVNESDGKILWQQELSWAAPNTLTLGKDLYICNGPEILAFDMKTGEKKWTSPKLLWRKNVPTYFAPTLVAAPGGILYAGGENYVGQLGSEGVMTCLNPSDGSIKWQAPHPCSGYKSPQDIFVINDHAWCGRMNSKPGSKSKENGIFTGFNLESGGLNKEFPGNNDSYWFHHRCHRAKATENYFITSRTGIELIDTKSGEWTLNHWVRGACVYGIMPANGLIYAPPHPCVCYPESKLSGFNAVSGPRDSKTPVELEKTERFFKGPAYDIAVQSKSKPAYAATDWPTYRGGAARNGSTTNTAKSKLASKWKIKLGGKLSQPIVAAGKVFVAQCNNHKVVAIDQASGKLVWEYVVGGRIDSSPTYYKGMLLVGCKDGYVYCLNSADGQLAWKFRAAPYDQRQMVYEQLESLWPVHGSVLIRDDVAFITAGRSMFLEGGMYLYRMDPLTGKLLSTNKMDRKDPFAKTDPPEREGGLYKETGTIVDRISHLSMPVGSSDILSSEGNRVFMKSQPFDLQGKRTRTRHLDYDQQSGADKHLFAANGFLDDSWWHRSFWQFGTGVRGGPTYFYTGKYAPAGKIMVLDNDNIYIYGRNVDLWRWTVATEYRLFSVERSIPSKNSELKKNTQNTTASNKKKKTYTDGAIESRWSFSMPVMVRAMVKAGDLLYTAGPADIVDELSISKKLELGSGNRNKVQEQAELFSGSDGCIVWTVSAKDGKKISETKLDVLPVFDGMISAGGNIYMSTVDGQVVCYETN